MFKSARLRLRAAVFACAAALGLGAYAATVTGYGDFGDVAGVQLWRTAATDSGVTDFAFAKFAAVAADGTVGETYTQGSSSTGTHWRRWASKYNNGDNSAYYTAPGLVLVYDQAGLMATPSKGATFAPLSFGGLWVKELGANDTPYGLTDEANKSRVTEFGATGYATLFKFEKSFTINRGNASTFYGTATVNITGDAVFTASTGYATVVDAGATLKLTGDSTAAMSVGTGLTVNGTLDLTASTLPTISGNVTLCNGSSLVLPAGIATGAAISVPVCSGTLSSSGVISVKIGTADPINAALTVSGGAITQIDEVVVEQSFTSDYPSVVPAGYIYTFTASAATTLPDVTVNGTLKTEGDFTITDLKVAAGGALEVVSGNTTVGGAADCQIKGNVTVDAGATLTNTRTDSLDYNGSMTVDVSGTLAMGSTRWSIPSGCTFNLRGGASVTGTGDTLASLDIINANGTGLNVWAGTGSNSVTIEGPVRVRANETRIWVASGTTLVLQGGIVEKNQQTGSFRQTGPGTLQLDATSTTLTGTSIMTQGTLRLNNTTRAFPLELQGNNSHLEIVATSAETIVPVNVTSIANNNVALTGSGKANGTITKTAAPSGDLATFLQSSAWEGTFVADWAGANGTRFDINSYGNANSTVRVTKLVGGYVSGSNANVTVVPTVEVSGFMTLDNGYSGKVTTLTKLTGSGVFTNKTYSVDVTTLDNFTGTLATLISTQYVGMRIGTINLSSTPAAGAKIVNVTSDSNIGNIGNTKVSVNGVVDDTIALEVKSDGIYVAVPATTVTITVPAIDNTIVTVTTNGVAVSPTEEGDINKYEVAKGAAIVVTYAAAAGYVIDGSATYEFTAIEDYALKPTGTSAVQYAALVSDGTTYLRVSDALTYVYMLMPTNLTVTVTDATWEDNGTYDDYFVWDSNVRTYTPKEMAVRIGVYCYPTLASAVAEATDGQTVTLLADVTLDATVVVTNSLTLNLNGFDIAATDARALWIKAGTVSITGEGVVSANGNGLGETSSVIRVGDGATNANAAGLTIGASVAVESAKCYGVTAFGKNTPGITLVVNGTVAVTSSGEADAAISGNGSPGLAETYITINSGATVTSANSAAIYNPGAGTLTVNGGTITGKHGIVARAGSVAVNGGTITATGTAQDAETIGDSANVIPCAAIAYDAGANYPGFDDGTAIAVTGGTFTSNVDSIDTTGEPTVAVSGGKFSSAVPAEYCAEGFEPVGNSDGTYGVRVDKGWIYEDADFPGYTGSWNKEISYDETTHKAAIEDGATYTASKPSDGRMVTLNMTIAFDDACSDDEAYEGVKAAVRLGEGETEGTYVFQLYTTNELGSAAWLNAAASGVTPTIDQDYAFAFVLDMTNRTYTVTVDDVPLTVAGAATLGFASANASDTVQSIEFTGAGKVSSIIGSYEDIPVPEGFAEDDTFGVVTLTAAQAAWLNGQANYDALAAKIKTMDATAFNDAYLLNLDILDTNSGYTFAVKGIVVGEDKVDVTVTLTRTGALTENEKAKPIVGTLKLKGTAALGTKFTVLGETAVEFDANADFGEGATETTVTVDTTKTDAKFYQPVIE